MVVYVAVKLLEHVHIVVVLGCDEHLVSVATHKHATDADMTAYVDAHVANHIVRIVLFFIVVSQHLLHGSRIAAAIHVAVNADSVLGGGAVDVDAHLIGKRTPRVDVHYLHRIGCRSERRHGASHRHCIDKWHCLRLRVVRINRIILVHGNLVVAVAVVGVQVVAVACAVDVAIYVATEDAYAGAIAAVVLEVAVIVEAHIDVSRHVVAAVYVAVNVDVRIFERSRGVGCVGAYAHRCTLKHVTHKSAAEDVAAVYRLYLYVCGAYRTVRASAEHTTAEQAAGTHDVRVAVDLARIAATNDVHYRVAAEEVLVFFTLNDVDAAVDASSVVHLHIHVSITNDDGAVAITTAEDAEVGRTHLLENLSPLVALKEVLALVSSRHQLGVFMEQSLGHGEVCIAAHLACHVAAGIDVMVYLELQLLVVVLRRVGHTVDEGGWLPRAGTWSPVHIGEGFAAEDKHVGVAGDIG